MKYGQSEKALSYSNACNKKRATCFATLLQNELYKGYPEYQAFLRGQGRGDFRSPFFASIFPLFPRNDWYSGYISDVERFTADVRTCLTTIRLQGFFFFCGKTSNIAIQLVLQQCCKTSCTFLVAYLTVHLHLVCLSELGMQRVHAHKEAILSNSFWCFLFEFTIL